MGTEVIFSQVQSASQAFPGQPSRWGLSQQVNISPIVSEAQTEAAGSKWSQ